MCDEVLTTRNTVITKIMRSIPFRLEDDLSLKSMKLQKEVSTYTEVEDWETLSTLTAEMRGKSLTAMAGLKGMGKMSSQMPASCLQES